MKMTGTMKAGSVGRLIASRIEEARKAVKPRLSKTKLARIVGAHRNSILNWVKTGSIRAIELYQIARITGKPVSFFFGTSPVKKKPTLAHLLV